jgi:membrane-associated phospholipid phosphatase
MITLSIQAPLKMITSRAYPGIVSGWSAPNSKPSDRTDDFSGEFNWFTLDFVGGWPSGHMANTMAAATTIAQISHDNFWVKFGVYAYAALMSFGISIYDHWASDVVAGALIGYAIGTTVGRSFRKLMEGKENKISFYITPNTVAISLRI